MSGIVGHRGLLLAGVSPPSGVTWNAADKHAGITLSGSDLVATRAAGGSVYRAVRGNTAITGKRYWEIVISVSDAIALPGDYQIIGIMGASDSLAAHVGAGSTGWGYATREGALYHNATQTIVPGGLPTAVQDDVLMFAVDTSAGKLWIGKNGTWFGSANPGAGTGAHSSSVAGTQYPATSLYRSPYANTARFSSGNAYSVPSGFSMF